MLTVAFIAFMLFQYVGDPVTNLLGQDATPEQREQLRRTWAGPALLRAVRALRGNALQGEFGLSLRQGRKVAR
jgi:peptide/nickel transport system permease protein